MPEKLSDVVAIKRFFELNGGRKVSTQEMMSLTKADREELGELARIELSK